MNSQVSKNERISLYENGVLCIRENTIIICDLSNKRKRHIVFDEEIDYCFMNKKSDRLIVQKILKNGTEIFCFKVEESSYFRKILNSNKIIYNKWLDYHLFCFIDSKYILSLLDTISGEILIKKDLNINNIVDVQMKILNQKVGILISTGTELISLAYDKKNFEFISSNKISKNAILDNLDFTYKNNYVRFLRFLDKILVFTIDTKEISIIKNNLNENFVLNKFNDKFDDMQVSDSIVFLLSDKMKIYISTNGKDFSILELYQSSVTQKPHLLSRDMGILNTNILQEFSNNMIIQSSKNDEICFEASISMFLRKDKAVFNNDKLFSFHLMNLSKEAQELVPKEPKFTITEKT